MLVIMNMTHVYNWLKFRQSINLVLDALAKNWPLLYIFTDPWAIANVCSLSWAMAATIIPLPSLSLLGVQQTLGI